MCWFIDLYALISINIYIMFKESNLCRFFVKYKAKIEPFAIPMMIMLFSNNLNNR